MTLPNINGLIVAGVTFLTGGLLGVFVHEISHFLTAFALGHQVTIDWKQLNTIIAMPERKIDRILILVSPIAVGAVTSWYLITSVRLTSLFVLFTGAYLMTSTLSPFVGDVIKLGKVVSLEASGNSR